MKRLVKILSIVLLMMILATTICFAEEELELKSQVNVSDTVSSELKEDLDGNLLDEEYAHRGIEAVKEKIGDIYKIEEKVEITDFISGNIYVIADEVKITSPYISGNLFIIADKVSIDSTVVGSAYIITDDLAFTGDIDDIYAVASKATFGSNSYISRSVRVIGEDVNFYGMACQDLYAVSEKLSLSDGEREASIDGNLYYTAEGEVKGEIYGEKIKIENKSKEATAMIENTAKKISTFSYIHKLATVLVVVGILVMISIKQNCVKSNIKERVFKNIGVGVASLILAPIVAVILMCTGIGLTIGTVLFVTYLIAVLTLSTTITSVSIAKELLKQEDVESINKSKFFGLAVLIEYAIYLAGRLLPVIGPILVVVATLNGLGDLTRITFKYCSKKQ